MPTKVFSTAVFVAADKKLGEVLCVYENKKPI